MFTKGDGEEEGERLGVWDLRIHTTIYKIDNQQGLTVWYRELYLISLKNVMKIYICIYLYMH